MNELFNETPGTRGTRLVATGTKQQQNSNRNPKPLITGRARPKGKLMTIKLASSISRRSAQLPAQLERVYRTKQPKHFGSESISSTAILFDFFCFVCRSSLCVRFRFRMDRSRSAAVLRALCLQLDDAIVTQRSGDFLKNYFNEFCLSVPPMWISQPTDVQTVSGHSIELLCQVQGVPVPHVTWYFSKGTTSF